MHKRVLLIALLFATVPLAHSHDPGLSRASVQLREAGVAIRMVFAWQDLQVLVPMDTNYDGTLTADEFFRARSDLHSNIKTAIEVRGARENLPPKSVHIEPALSDAVSVDLYYEHTEPSAIQIHLPLIARLARGHRQYLTIQDTNGKLIAQYIVDAGSSSVFLQKSGAEVFDVFKQYLLEGIWHIWIGFDHILFLLTLLLPAVLVYRKSSWLSQTNLRAAITDTLKVVTAFTIAHSVTLALAVLDIITPPPRLVEAVIACSVLITAVNSLRPVFPASRWLLAFAFGLVHGFGFAGVLMDLDLPANGLIVSLLGFNLGVEAGQLAIVAIVFPIAAYLRHTPLYRTWVFGGGSATAALIAMVWMFERIFDFELLGI